MNIQILKIDQIIEKLKEFFTNQKEVKLAYLFGSTAKGKMGKLSDVDIAVLLDENLSKKDRFHLELELISRITSLLKINTIDLVVMNESAILMNFNIIKGILLKGEESVKIKVESGILSQYLDIKYHLQRFARKTIDRIAMKGLV